MAAITVVIQRTLSQQTADYMNRVSGQNLIHNEIWTDLLIMGVGQEVSLFATDVSSLR